MTLNDSKTPSHAPARDGSAVRELIDNGRTALRLIADERVPAGVKLVPALAILYLLNPLDLLPDFGLGIGQLDDLAVIMIAIKLFISLAPEDVVAELRGETPSESTIPADYRVREDGIG